MRLPILTAIILIIVNIATDYCIWKRIEKKFLPTRWPGITHAWLSLIGFIWIIVTICLPRRSGSNEMLITIMWMIFAYLTVYLPKYIYLIVSALDYIPKLWNKNRWSIFSLSGSIIAISLFIAMWWGAIINRTNIDIVEIELEYANLPEQFDGYRIVHFSDLHVGTYGNDTTFVSKVVDAINSTHPDLVLFTGDIVNRKSEELIPHTDALSRIKASDGIMSVLGNHDYGDYSTWPTIKAKKENMQLLYDLHDKMGWKLLNNSHHLINRGNDTIAVIGVENWGDPPFPQYGDLKKAMTALPDSTFSILLTHNPTHWDKEIADNADIDIALSLSGHTHAMQISIGEWTPAIYRYKHCRGLYNDSDNSHQLYVNVGLGTVALPMRVGATPEITLITLNRKHF